MPRPEPVPAPIDTAWPADWLRPVFSSPRVGAVMTTRAGGVSQAPWDSLNLRDAKFFPSGEPTNSPFIERFCRRQKD